MRFNVTEPPSDTGCSKSTGSTFETKPVTFGNDVDSQLISLQLALKLADLSHLGATEDVHRHWVGLMQEEMYQQGDEQKRLGVKVSALMDRNEEGVTKGQVAFFDIVAIPMARMFGKVYPECKVLAHNIAKNANTWRATGKQYKRTLKPRSRGSSEYNSRAGAQSNLSQDISGFG